jgi:signal transduction histidine kinase/ligand-binding sensor domain-containing protein
LTRAARQTKIAPVMRCFIWSALLVGLAVGPLGAAPASHGLSSYVVTTWSEQDGLPAGNIHSLEQGAEGDLWLGTETGLVRFDGTRFVPFENLGRGRRLPSGAVETILRGRDDSLWVGLTGRPSVARIRSGAVTLFGEADGLPSGQVTSLFEDRTGAIWAGSIDGLFRFDGRRWSRVALPADAEGPVLAVREDTEGRLWAASPRAIVRRTSPNSGFEVVERLAVASNRWQSLSVDRRGRMWRSDFEHGFTQVDAASSESAGRTSGRVWGLKLLHDTHDVLWVATRGRGLWRVDDPEGRRPPTMLTADDGLVHDAVQAVFEDRDGNIWLGTPAGLQRLSPKRVAPLKDLGVVRVLEAMPDGSVWVGTSNGLSRVSSTGRRAFTSADGLSGTVVLTLHADRTGGLWVATESGVSRYAAGRFTPLDVGSSTMQRVFALAAPSDDDLWLRDFWFRLYHWRDGRMVDVADVPEVFRQNVFSLLDDERGGVWIGGAGGRLGVRRRDETFESFTLPVGAVMRLAEDRDGGVWAGGSEGLSRVTATGAVESITLAQGFPGGVKAIVEDRGGELWVGIGTGIIRIERAEFARAAAAAGRGFHYRLLNAADGVAGTPIAEGANPGVRATDGTLWFSTSGGATIVDPATVGASPSMPPVRIESVTADDQRFDAVAGRFEPSRSSHLHMAFSALSLTDPTRVRFRYRLDGFDHNWIEPGASREASYANVPAGDYRFIVEATNGDGVWHPGATYAFGIEPMFYQTVWFYGLCVAMAAAGVAGVWQLHVRQVRQQFALVLGERIRMSREIHDTLLQGVAGLALEIDDLSHRLDGAPAGARERVLALRRRLESYLREARLSIHNLRSPQLAAKDLPQALREAGERAIGHRDVRLDLVVTGEPGRCPPQVKEQLLLIGQEAVSNAVRHGNPTRVGLELACDEDRACLRIVDDGRGFVPDEAIETGGHFGLRGMHERAEQVRGTVVIRSAPGQGTLVEAVVPTA